MNVRDSVTLAPFIAAVSNGQIVQCNNKTNAADHPDWQDISPDHQWSTESYAYRIKTEPVLRPYPDNWSGFHGLIGTVVRYTKKPSMTSLRAVVAVVVASGKAVVYLGAQSGGVTPTALFRDYEFADGTPCGVYIDEDVKVPSPKKKGRFSNDEDTDYEEPEPEDEEEIEEDEDPEDDV